MAGKQQEPRWTNWRGRYAQDQRTRGTVVDFRCPVRIGSVDIRPGDAIFGDLHGVVVIPREIEAEVFEGAWTSSVRARVEESVLLLSGEIRTTIGPVQVSHSDSGPCVSHKRSAT